MLYAGLALLFLLSAACTGFGITGPAPALPAPPGTILTPPPPPPPPTLTPVTPPMPTPTLPEPMPTAAPPTLSPTPTVAMPGTETMPGAAIPTPTPPPAPAQANQLIPYVQVTAGKYHACGLRADGVAHCWGRNPNGETNVPARMLFRQISAGLNFTCGLNYAGNVFCWGNNAAGQTAAPPGLFAQIAAGRQHACALDSNGTAVCWGAVTYAPADFAFITIGSGLNYSCGLTAEGRLECWGVVRNVSQAGPFTALAAGLYHVCVLRPDGAAECYGDNLSRQSEPPKTAFAKIAAGWHHSCGITRTGGVLECWGAGVPGQAGQRLAAPSGVFTALSIGWFNNCALRPDGSAQCWRQPRLDSSVRPTANLAAAFGGREFVQPVELFPWPAKEGGGLAVVERAGSIYAYDAGNSDRGEPRPILDLTDRINPFGESGMVSAALDPNFDQFPFLYVYYHTPSGERPPRVEGRLSRFPVVDGAAVPADELVIMSLPQLRTNHLGGAIRFGPDGMLYLGLGDNLNSNNAQSLTSRHGKIIRIDVRGASAEQPYRIPDDNPFVETPDARPEIWAYGLRNPWRMDFDDAGNLWVADVGTSAEEEVSIATAGANLGWPVFEGNSCRSTAEDCAALTSATAPVVSYLREEGCAIIGGVASPHPDISYIFGDYCTRKIWALERDATVATGWAMRQIAQADGFILAFGADSAGAVYVLTAQNPILRLEW